MKIKLLEITPNAEALIEYAGRISHNSNVGDYGGNQASKFIQKLIKMGHESVLEHASATFLINGVSRAFSHQLVRHRLASYTQRSQRYVSEDNFGSTLTPANIVLDPDAFLLYERFMKRAQKVYKELINLKIPKEDARFVLPNAVGTEIVVTANFRQWRHMIQLRTSKHAQWEIRYVFIWILKELTAKCPRVFGGLLEDLRKEKENGKVG